MAGTFARRRLLPGQQNHKRLLDGASSLVILLSRPVTDAVHGIERHVDRLLARCRFDRAMAGSNNTPAPLVHSGACNAVLLPSRTTSVAAAVGLIFSWFI